MAIAKVFKSGNSQAVRLPKEFRVKSKQLQIFKKGSEIILREEADDLSKAFELLAQLPADFKLRRRRDLPQKRKGL